MLAQGLLSSHAGNPQPAGSLIYCPPTSQQANEGGGGELLNALMTLFRTSQRQANANTNSCLSTIYWCH
jgi:hypothetical protein